MIKIQDTEDTTPFKFVNIYRPFGVIKPSQHRSNTSRCS